METSAAITNPWHGAQIHVLERTSSTMDDALALGREGSPTGTVVIAGFQEKGRGRVPGRTWTSPPWESLLATVIVLNADMHCALRELPLRAGVAAALAVQDVAGLRVDIRWPNDLVFDGKKLAGLLCEAHGGIALAGFGINCAQSAFPPELSAIACSIAQACGTAAPVFPLLEALLVRLRQALVDELWREKLNSRLHARGRVVRVSLIGDARVIEGRAREVDEEGRLVLLLADGQEAHVAQGELTTAP
jgi:BirA family transcriptional regulator, biotin operon repressor / biotin---[acetyl-CoA-carboxylase] ligase